MKTDILDVIGWRKFRAFLEREDPVKRRDIFASTALLAIAFAVWPVLMCHVLLFGLPSYFVVSNGSEIIRSSPAI